MIKALPKAFFRALCYDGKGNIWAGTYGDGVYVYNTSTAKSERLIFSINQNQNIATNIINNIYYSTDSLLWLATEGGLCCYNPRNKNLNIYNARNGLPADVICAVLEDDKKNIWASTSKGLARFNPSTKEIKVFNKSQGLLTDQFNYRSAFKDAAGNFYFGSVKGLISFNPDSINTNKFIPPIYITGFQVYNKELSIDSNNSPLEQSITFTENITLPYNQSSFSIDFAALHFSSPSTIAYAYKMTGLDKDWTYLSTNRKAYFTELAPGKYSFVVKYIDDKDIRNNYTSLNIEILPPYWKTWWAYALYAIFALLTTVFVIKFFIDRSKQEIKENLSGWPMRKRKKIMKTKSISLQM